MITDSLFSNSLHESRNICVYLPESFNSQKQYPIIYCTDGQIIIEDDYKSKLDSLISSGIIEPIVLIGIYSNEKELGKNTTFRQIEYFKDFQKDSISEQRFKNHLQFFRTEAPEYILDKYSIKKDTTKSALYGFSNGGGFGMTLFFEGGSQYKNYICFSPLGLTTKPLVKGKVYPNLYISYGTEELFIMVDSYKELIKYLKKNKFVFTSTPYPGGHDENEWKREFGVILGKIYNVKK